MTLALASSIAACREHVSRARQPSRTQREGHTVGFVPTMGALHSGHAQLVERARAECEAVVVSIFVNPTQFDRPEDLARYPRVLDADLALCESLGVDVVFAPTAAEMYPTPPACVVDVARLTDHLCGRFRPGHFQAVATVVTKLLQIVQPDRAYFGEKDAQQLAVVRRLVTDLNIPVAIVGVPTVREADGLALSSRNRHLSPDERQRATLLIRALKEAERLIVAGERDAHAVVAAARATLSEGPAIRLEYLEIVDPEELQPVTSIVGPALVAGALWIGTTRLIDNLLVHP